MNAVKFLRTHFLTERLRWLLLLLFHIFKFICIWSSLEGACNKIRKKIKRKESDLTSRFKVMKYYTGVCFFPEKQRLFSDIVQDSDNSGIEIKRFRTSDNNNNIIFNDFTS